MIQINIKTIGVSSQCTTNNFLEKTLTNSFQNMEFSKNRISSVSETTHIMHNRHQTFDHDHESNSLHSLPILPASELPHFS